MGAHRLGRCRSDIETNLRKEWGTSSLTDEQIDKCRYIERKLETNVGFVDTGMINAVE
jgi:hypothetical protein